MAIRSSALWLGALALCACNHPAGEQIATNAEQPSNVVENGSHSAIGPPSTGSNARTPLAEPKGPIDPKSAEAAGQIVQSYGALIEQKRFAEAEKLWRNVNDARTFGADLKSDLELHLKIGDLGEPEGAAGSIYLTMPIICYGTQSSGATFRRKADVTLRRVNDVPGSTEEQRRWHIERIDWSASG